MAEAGSGEGLKLKLTAVGSGREIDLSDLSAPVLFICFGQETQSGIEPIEAAARDRYASASRLLVAHLVDLHKVPGLLRKVAEGVLGAEHKKALEQLPPGVRSEDYVVLLPDWDGAAVKALGLEDATKAVGLALVEKGGSVRWRYQGPAPEEALASYLAANPL